MESKSLTNLERASHVRGEMEELAFGSCSTPAILHSVSQLIGRGIYMMLSIWLISRLVCLITIVSPTFRKLNNVSFAGGILCTSSVGPNYPDLGSIVWLDFGDIEQLLDQNGQLLCKLG